MGPEALHLSFSWSMPLLKSAPASGLQSSCRIAMICSYVCLSLRGEQLESMSHALLLLSSSSLSLLLLLLLVLMCALLSQSLAHDICSLKVYWMMARVDGWVDLWMTRFSAFPWPQLRKEVFKSLWQESRPLLQAGAGLRLHMGIDWPRLWGRRTREARMGRGETGRLASSHWHLANLFFIGQLIRRVRKVGRMEIMFKLIVYFMQLLYSYFHIDFIHILKYKLYKILIMQIYYCPFIERGTEKFA